MLGYPITRQAECIIIKHMRFEVWKILIKCAYLIILAHTPFISIIFLFLLYNHLMQTTRDNFEIN